MDSHATLIVDPGGKIVWANREAHENVDLPPGGLLGRNYLEFCPPETHAALLELQRRKLTGENVKFRLDLGPGRPKLEVTSGPVRVGPKIYFFVVGRRLSGRAVGDETALGLLATSEALSLKAARIDLNSCMLSALKDEAGRLRGRIRLSPGRVPAVRARPWKLRLVLRYLLVRSTPARGMLSVVTGELPGRVWAEITSSAVPGRTDRGMKLCRGIVRREGGGLRVLGHTWRLTLPVA